VRRPRCEGDDIAELPDFTSGDADLRQLPRTPASTPNGRRLADVEAGLGPPSPGPLLTLIPESWNS
jgi:hypothetical protein